MTARDGGRLTVLVASLAAVAVLLALTWLSALTTIRSQRAEAEASIAASALSQAEAFRDKLQRQLLEVDETLRILVHAWESNPGSFNLLSWRSQLVLMSQLSADVFMVDEKGIVRHDTVPEGIGRDVSDADYFRDVTDRIFDDGSMFIGAARLGTTVRLWHLNVAHRLHHPNGAFAGVMVAALRSSSLSEFYRMAHIDTHGMIAVVGLNDGRVRVAEGPNQVDPGTLIDTSAMFQAMLKTKSGVWTGHSALDGIERVHGFDRVPDRDLAVLVALDRGEAMHPTEVWVRQAYILATAITVLLLVIAALLLREFHKMRRHEQVLARESAMLAGATTQLEMARSRADAKVAQLEATLAGVAEGILIIDGDLRLVEWNRRFAEIAGLSADNLSVGQPIEEILRMQASSGQLGDVDVEAEVARRMSALRSDSHAATLEQVRSTGTIVELRRMRLADGGLVTVYTDVGARQEPRLALPAPTLSRGVVEKHDRRVPRTRVLLIEPSGASQSATAAMLRREGHMVDVASSGEAAVHAAATQPYDLIFIEVMPEANGVDTTSRIRALDGPAAGLPVIALTTMQGAETESMCLAAGMNGVIVQPVAIDGLLGALATHVWWRVSDQPPVPESLEIEMV